MQKISLITPVFNSQEYIADCLRSAFYSFSDGDFEIEHIVVDDGSTDSSMAVARQTIDELQSASPDAIHRQAWFKNARYSYQSHSIAHSGRPSAVRNFALGKATGDYIFCLDADDVLLRRSINVLLDAARRKNASMTYGNYLACNASTQYSIGFDYWGKDFASLPALLEDFLLAKVFIPPTALYRTDTLSALGGWDEKITFGEDCDLNLRLALAGHLPQYIECPVILKRSHPGNLTRFYGKKGSNIRQAEFRAHYTKHRSSIENLLAEDKVAEIRTFLNFEDATEFHYPPSEDEAERMSGVL